MHLRYFVALVALLFSSLAPAQNVRVSDLPPAVALSGTEKIPAVQSGATVRLTPSQIVTYAGATFQPLDPDLTSIAALTTTSTGRNLLTAADAAGIRSQAGTVIGTDVQAFDAELAAIAGLTSAADRLPYFTGSGTAALTTFTSAGRALIDDADAAAQRATLGVVIGTDVQAFNAKLAAISGLTMAADTCIYWTGASAAASYSCTATGRSIAAAASSSAARTTLGLVIGTDVQAYDADLAALAANSTAGLWAYTGAGTGSARTLTAPASGLTISNPSGTAGNPTFALANDLAAVEGLAANGLAARTATDTWAVRTITAPAAGITVTNGDGVSGNPTLALANDLSAVEGLSGTGIARRTGVDTWSVGTTVSVAEGGTGVTTSTGTGNVVLSASPTLTGTPVAPTAAAGDNSTQISTTAFVETAIAAGAWTSYTPTISASTPAGSGFTYTINSARYAKIGRIVILSARITITNMGTGPSATGGMTMTLPYNAANPSTGMGRENALTGNMLQGNVSAGSGLLTVLTYSNGSPLGLNADIRVTIVYESDS